MNSPLRIRGIVPPVPTPLTRSGEVDADAFRRIFDHLVDGGAQGAFVLGSTGELASLSPAQRLEAIRAAVDAAGGRIPVLTGITDNCFASTVELGRRARDLGADAVVVAAPCYYELSPDELRRHFEEILPCLDLPVLIYNMPWLTGHVLDDECLKSALAHPRVIGFKDSSGDLAYLRRLIDLAAERPDVTVLVGNDHLYHAALQCGAHGAVGGGGNIYPFLFRALQDAHDQGDQAAAAECQQRISRLGRQIFDITGRPTSVFVAIKAALACLGLCEPHVAPPLTACTLAQMDRLRRVLESTDALRQTNPATAVA